MELEPREQSMAETAQGSQPHTIAQVFAARQGDRVQHNQHFEHHEQQDMRRVDVTNQVLQSMTNVKFTFIKRKNMMSFSKPPGMWSLQTNE